MGLFRDSWEVWRRKVDSAIGGGGDPIDSKDVTYNGTSSGLSATNVQAAIDEVAGDVSSLDSEDVAYDSTSSGLSATNVQGAIDEIAGDISDLEDAIAVSNAPFTVGSTISAYERCTITKVGKVVVCNIACRLDSATSNGTLVLHITNSDYIPSHDVFGAGVSNGVAYLFKLQASVGNITIEQLATDSTTIPANSGCFGSLSWVVD